MKDQSFLSREGVPLALAELKRTDPAGLKRDQDNTKGEDVS